MSRTTLFQWVAKQIGGRQTKRKQPRPRRVCSVEQLGERITPAVNAFAFGGALTVLGDAADNVIEVSRNAAGELLVNGGAVKIHGGTPTVANTSRIQIFGLAGDDQLSLNEANGTLPSARLYGGSGNDTLISGAAADFLFGEAGNDTLLGKGGVDFLFGGAGNDTLTGGAGNDQVFGQAGSDRMIWNPGDGTDLNEGGAGTDTVEVNGGNGAEDFVLSANGARVRFDRTTPGPFSLDIGTSEAFVLNANDGNDTFSATGNLAALIQVTVDGGAGDDTINGTNGADRLLGGDGNDLIDGNAGADVALLGAGDDTFIWDPGDGSDTIEGQDGADTMRFNGSDLNEVFTASANGERLRFLRNLGNIVMDTNDVETVDLNTLGGTDEVTLNDLAGTDVTAVNLNLAGGGGKSVVVNATAGDDAIAIAGDTTGIAVFGLAAQVSIVGADAIVDRLTVNALAGDDVVDASALAAVSIQLTANGGTGDDTLLGGEGNDVLAGNDGDDTLLGGPGADTLDGGLGDNVLIQD